AIACDAVEYGAAFLPGIGLREGFSDQLALPGNVQSVEVALAIGQQPVGFAQALQSLRVVVVRNQALCIADEKLGAGGRRFELLIRRERLLDAPVRQLRLR